MGTDLPGIVSVAVRQALDESGLFIGGMRVITDRRVIATDVYCPSHQDAEVQSLMADRFPNAIVELRSDRVQIIW